MGDVDNYIIEIMDNPTFQQTIDSDHTVVQQFALALDQAIEMNESVAINHVVQATKVNPINGIQMIAAIRTYPLLALKLIRYLDDRPKISNRSPDTLRTVIRSYACTLKSCIDNTSFTKAWEDHKHGRTPKIRIHIKNKEKRRAEVIKRLSALEVLHEQAVRQEFSLFDMDVKRDLLTSGLTDQ